MRKILFPTDFSANAAHALNYAIEVINRLEAAQLTIVHTYHIPTNVGSINSFDSYFQQAATAEMNRIVNRIQPLLKTEVTIETILKKAVAIPTIAEMANEYDLVIMGTHGASGLKEIFIGSFTNDVIKNTKTPVLAIPKDYEFKPVNNMVLSIDNQPIKQVKGIQIIKDFLKIFSADLMLFHTEEQAADRHFDESVTQVFDKVGYAIDFNFNDKSIHESIEEMVIDYDVDLLCMVRRKSGFLTSFFHQSVTSKEVFHTKIPLLVLQDKKSLLSA